MRMVTLCALALALCAPVPAYAEPNNSFFGKVVPRRCRCGLKNMPDVAEYVLAKPGADKLGYGGGSPYWWSWLLSPSVG